MLEYFKWVKAHKNDPIVYGPVLGIAFLIVVVLGYLFVQQEELIMPSGMGTYGTKRGRPKKKKRSKKKRKSRKGKRK